MTASDGAWDSVVPEERAQAALREPADGSPTEIGIVARECPLCGDDNAGTPAHRHSHSFWTMKQCRRCRLVYLDRAPAYEALHSVMAWEKTSRLEEHRRAEVRPVSFRLSKATRWRLKLLPRRNMPALLERYAEPGRVIDLGCGDGGPLAHLPERFTPFGIEISSQLAATAMACFAPRGGEVINASCIDGLRRLPSEHFSAATLRSYLEHELDPKGVLTELHRTLRAGGIAVVKVPNHACLNRRLQGPKWCGYRHPDHLNHFTPKTLTLMAQAAGFTTWFGLTWRLPTSDNMWAVLRKTS